MTPPLVSVIVPAFNHEHYVRACLDSVEADPYPALEIVVVDDGSADGTAAAVRDWAASRTSASHLTFVTRPHQGLTRTLNELLRPAHGQYVIPLASDDYLLPDRIRDRVAKLEADRTTHALFSDCIVVDERGELLHESGLFAYYRANRKWLFDRLAVEIVTNWSAAGPVLIYRREAVLAIGGYSEDLLVEDWDLYLRLVARGWLEFMDGAVAAYRLHSTNVERNAPETLRRRLDDQRRVALRTAPLFPARERLLLMLRALSMSLELYGDRHGRGARSFSWVVRKAGRIARPLLALR